MLLLNVAWKDNINMFHKENCYEEVGSAKLAKRQDVLNAIYGLRAVPLETSSSQKFLLSI